MAFTARYGGRCEACDGTWRPGDLIASDLDTGVYTHAECSAATDFDPAARLDTVRGSRTHEPDLTPALTCPHCFLTLPVSGVCGVCE